MKRLQQLQHSHAARLFPRSSARVLSRALPAALLLAGAASAQVVDVAAGRFHVLALGGNGTVDAWGQAPTPWSDGNDWGQLDVPALPPGLSYVEVAAGGAGDFNGNDYPPAGEFSLALRSDGAVVAWGSNSLGAGNVPALPQGVTYTQIDAGNGHAVALRSDGTIAAWGANGRGQCNVPALPPGLTYVEVSAGGWSHDIEWCGGIWGPPPSLDLHGFTVARRSDDSIVVWGSTSFGQASVPALPAGVSIVELSAGSTHVAARLSDGSAIAWGDNQYGQCDVPAPPAGVVYDQVAADGAFTATRLSDGTVNVWGPSATGPYRAPALPAGTTYTDVSVGGTHYLTEYLDAGNCSLGTTGLGSFTGAVTHFLATRSDGTTVAWGGNLSVEANTSNYCTSTPNSTGFAATLRATGSATLGSNSLTLGASFVPDGFALFAYGPVQQQSPFGDGTLCVAGGLVRLLPAIHATAGQAEAVIDLHAAGIVNPGAQNFQCFFRDAAAGGTGWNSSDALQITFVL